jgi:hypothetical protein
MSAAEASAGAPAMMSAAAKVAVTRLMFTGVFSFCSSFAGLSRQQMGYESDTPAGHSLDDWHA